MTEEPTRGLVLEFGFTDRLRKAREHLGLDQKQFAALTGISRGTISNYEDPTYESKRKPYIVSAWALATGVSREWLETGEGVAPNPPKCRQEASGPAGVDRLVAEKRARNGRSDRDNRTYDQPLAA